jgi:transposase InsO family protein
MDSHKNARTTAHSRAEIARRVHAGVPVATVARAFGICDRTVKKWAERARRTTFSLEDGSCRPRSSPTAISSGLIVEIERLRRLRRTGAEIADIVRVSAATVSRTLQMLGLNKLSALEPPVVMQRYEWLRPGQLVHVDVKKLGRIGQIGHRITGDRRSRVRGIGWEYVHVCVDDCSRLAYVEVLPDERGVTMAAFMRRALAWFRVRGVLVQRVLSDNGSGYISRAFAAACRRLRLVHRRTRPYTPRTNGKAERFIRTLQHEWAYARPFHSSAERTGMLARWLHYYNEHRRHRALNGQPPISRLVQSDDLLRAHS